MPERAQTVSSSRNVSRLLPLPQFLTSGTVTQISLCTSTGEIVVVCAPDVVFSTHNFLELRSPDTTSTCRNMASPWLELVSMIGGEQMVGNLMFVVPGIISVVVTAETTRLIVEASSLVLVDISEAWIDAENELFTE